MMVDQKLEAVINDLIEIKSSFEFGPECKVSIEGREAVLQCDRRALVQIAIRILKLYGAVPGAHFTIDAADIAVDDDAQLTIAVADVVD